MRYGLILCCLLIGQLMEGQSVLPKFGEFTQEEIDLKECPFDKNAEAVVLFDDAVSDHDDEYHLITHRRIRIKIFNQREIDRGNIRIRFYSKKDFEFIRNIKAVSFTPEAGRPVLSHLDNKSIYTDKEDNVYSSTKFAIPNVKPGSIVEYEYDSYMEHYGGLDSWVFQHELPTLKSCYLLTVLPNTEFQYSVQKKSIYPIIIKSIPESGKIYYEMDNIPGLKSEPYMDAVNDYLQRVTFQLASYTSSNGAQVKVHQTWKDLAYDLINDKDFGGAIKKDLPKIDEVNGLVSREITDSGKVVAVYNYVRNNFTWNDYYSKYAPEGLKNVWEKRTGSTGEINLLLINLLQTFKLEVYPLLVAERNYGKIDTTYPFLDKFNKVVAYAIANGKTFILDATQKFCPPGLTPFPLLNTIAFLADKKKFRLIPIISYEDAYQNKIVATATVDTKGQFIGTAVIRSSAYAKQVRTEQVKTDRKKFIKETLQEPGSEIVVDDCVLENLDDDARPLVQNISFHKELDASGGFVFLVYNLFMGLGKNPFTANDRFTNINFGFPYDISLQLNLNLPEGSTIDKLPPDKKIISADQPITLTRKFKWENNTLAVTIQFTQNTTLVQYDEYDNLKLFYKAIADLMNEPVILKIAN